MSSGDQAQREAILKALLGMNREGRFPISALVDLAGAPRVTAVSPELDTQAREGVLTLVHKTALQMRGQASLEQTDEVTFYDASGRRLVCRVLRVGADRLVLMVLVPERTQTYRRLMNQALQAIHRALGD